MARKDAKAFLNVDAMLISSGGTQSCFTWMFIRIRFIQKRKKKKLLKVYIFLYQRLLQDNFFSKADKKQFNVRSMLKCDMMTLKCIFNYYICNGSFMFAFCVWRLLQME